MIYIANKTTLKARNPKPNLKNTNFIKNIYLFFYVSDIAYLKTAILEISFWKQIQYVPKRMIRVSFISILRKGVLENIFQTGE